MQVREGKRVSRLISTVVLFVVTLVVGILFYRVMIGFFVPLFLAALMVVIFRPVHEWISVRLGKRRRLAALTTTVTILLTVLLPTVLVIGVAAAQGTSLLSRVNYNTLAFALERTREQLGLEVSNIEPFARIPVLIQSLSEIESLTEPKELKTASERIRQFDQVLTTLESDFQPLSETQQVQLDQTRAELRTLEVKLLALVDDELAIGVSASPTETPPVSSAKVTDNPTETNEGTGDAPFIQALDDLAAPEEELALPETESAEPEEELEQPAPEVEYRSPGEQFQRELVRLDAETHQLVTVLLGGPVKSQLKLWANPTDSEIDELVGRGQEYLQPRILSVTSATGEFLVQTLIGISILTIALYFFLVDGPEMVKSLMKLSPLDDRYELRLLLEFDQTSRAVVLATVLSALAQGVLAMLGYYVAGLSSIILLFLLTTFMSLIPFLGAAAVWIPCALWLGIVEERWGAAIGLAIYGMLVVSSIDNLIKVFILHGRSQLHPLLALLSVLGGVQVFGPIGILVGPMVVVFLQSTLEILNHELSAYGSEEGERLVLDTGTSAEPSPEIDGGTAVAGDSQSDQTGATPPPGSPTKNQYRQARRKRKK